MIIGQRVDSDNKSPDLKLFISPMGLRLQLLGVSNCYGRNMKVDTMRTLFCLQITFKFAVVIIGRHDVIFVNHIPAVTKYLLIYVGHNLTS